MMTKQICAAVMLIVLAATLLMGCSETTPKDDDPSLAVDSGYEQYDALYEPVLDAWRIDRLKNIWWSEYYSVGFDKAIAKDYDVNLNIAWWFIRESDLYCAYHDMDNNGVPELFIATRRPDNAISTNEVAYILAVYALDNGVPVPLFDHTYIERAHLYLVSDGRCLQTLGSGGAAVNVSTFYRLASNGHEIEFIEMLDMDGFRNPPLIHISSDGTERAITQEEYDSIWQVYNDGLVGRDDWIDPANSLDWKLFSMPPYPPESKIISIDESDAAVYTYYNKELDEEVSVVLNGHEGVSLGGLEYVYSCFMGQNAYHRSYPQAEYIDPAFCISFGDRKFIFGSAQDGWSDDYYDENNYDSTLMVYEVDDDGTVWQYYLSTDPASFIYDYRRLCYPQEW